MLFSSPTAKSHLTHSCPWGGYLSLKVWLQLYPFHKVFLNSFSVPQKHLFYFLYHTEGGRHMLHCVSWTGTHTLSVPKLKNAESHRDQPVCAQFWTKMMSSTNVFNKSSEEKLLGNNHKIKRSPPLICWSSKNKGFVIIRWGTRDWEMGDSGGFQTLRTRQGLLQYRLLSPSQSFWFHGPGEGSENLCFWQVPRGYRYCWSGEHTLGTSGL